MRIFLLALSNRPAIHAVLNPLLLVSLVFDIMRFWFLKAAN